MKSFCLSLVVMFCFQLNAQNKEIIVSGHVTGSKYKKVIPNALIRLICTDSSISKTYTDSAGSYSFKKSINRNTVAILEIHPPEKKLPGLCPYSFKNKVFYFPEKLKLLLSVDSAQNTITQNVELAEGDVDYEPPQTIFFKTNSLDFLPQQENYSTIDTTMDCVMDFMLTYKKIFLTVVGYSDKNENNKQQLSEQRAKLIYDLLIKKGVETKRICYIGKGDHPSTRYQEFDYEGRIQSNSKIELDISKTACITKPKGY
jgi:hypothetical protein